MIVDDEFKQNVARLARYHHSPKDILILLDIPLKEHALLLEIFADDNSELALYYRKGILSKDQDISDGLENMIDSAADGAGDAARALNGFHRHKEYNDLKKELFNL